MKAFFFLSVLSLALFARFTVSGQTKKPISAKASHKVTKINPDQPSKMPIVNRWWWFYSPREVRELIYRESGKASQIGNDQNIYNPAIPSDSCKDCTAFENFFHCRMEFRFSLEGLVVRSWKMPRESSVANDWEKKIAAMYYNKFNGTWSEGAEPYGAQYYRSYCGDYVIYTAVVVERDSYGAIGAPIGEELRDCYK